MLDLIEEHRTGIIATLVFHIIVVGIMNVWYFEPSQDVANEDLVDVVLDNKELEKILELSEKAYEKVKAEEVTTGFKNLSVKERLERGKDVKLNKEAAKWTDDQIQKELEEFERSEFDRLAEERGPVPEFQPKETDDKVDQEKGEEDSSQEAVIKGPATVTCDLPGRTEVGRVYIPAYLCRGQGKVVVLITVDQDGNVEQARVDPSRSTSELHCHLKFSQEAAASTRFDRDPDAPIHQKGTITYVFLAQ